MCVCCFLLFVDRRRCWLLFVVRCSVFVAVCSSLLFDGAVCWLLVVIDCRLLFVCCLVSDLLLLCYLMFLGRWYMLLAVSCMLLVACGMLLFDVCRCLLLLRVCNCSL